MQCICRHRPIVSHQFESFLLSIQTILDKDLLSERGVICIDNALYKGEVYLEASERTDNGEALREFNQYVKEDPRTEQVHPVFGACQLLNDSRTIHKEKRQWYRSHVFYIQFS